jgi:predicted RecB family endonuclease
MVGRLDAAALESPQIRISLPDGRAVIARREHIERRAAAGATTWRGTVVGAPDDALTVSNVRGAISGTLTYGGEIYELQPRDGSTLLYAVDQDRLPQPGPLRPVNLQQERVATSALPASDALLVEAVPVLHDLLVLTTDAIRARYGAGLDGMILNAVSNANSAYAAGAVGITLNVVGIRSTSVTEGASMDAALEAVAADPATRQLRDQLGADVVVLVSDNRDYCGIAYLMTSASASFAPFAYGVVAGHCLSAAALAHEVGHIQGLSHDRETAGSTPSSRPYAYGYRVCLNDGTGVRDIMSYACTSGSATRLNEFSNPDRIVNGHVFGVAYELDPLRAADAVRALDDNAAVVAGFRPAAVAVPAAPAMLAPTILGPSRVDLAWQDASDDEQGFAVERSTAASGWVEIARTGPNETVLADVTVAPSTTYSYRVRAYNSAGYSAASNVVTLTTPATDTVPDPFSLPARRDVAPGTLVTSAAVTITGIDAPASVTVSGGEYSIGCSGDFTAAAGTIGDGQGICVRHTSAATSATTVATVLTIGGVQGRFESTTRAATSAAGGSSGGGGGGGAAGPALLLLGLAACLRRPRRHS